MFLSYHGYYKLVIGLKPLMKGKSTLNIKNSNLIEVDDSDKLLGDAPLRPIAAGTGWCFPGKTPFLDSFCVSQRVFPMGTQKVF